MIIQHNLMALNSYRQLNTNNLALARNLEKLSSGYRINRAGDDAAGLAISEKMRAQIKGLETASKNALDGISLIQTAEGALTEVHSMLNRMVELATQAANGIYDDQIDRAALDLEFQQLKDEIDRISKATNFNGKNLLDGTLAAGGGSSISGGNTVLSGQRIMNYDPVILTGSMAPFANDNSTLEITDTNTFVIDGTTIVVNWSVIDPLVIEAFKTDMQLLEHQPDDAAKLEMAKAIEQAINTAIDAVNNGTAHVTVGLNFTKDEFTITSGTTSGKSEVTIIAGAATSLSELYLGAESKKASDQTVSFSIAAGPIGTIYFGDTPSHPNARAGDLITTNSIVAGTTKMSDIVTYLNDALTSAVVNINTASVNIGSVPAPAADVLYFQVGENGNIELLNNTGYDIHIDNLMGNPAFATMLGLDKLSSNKAVSGGGLKLQIGDTGDEYNIISVSVDDMSCKGLGIQDLNIKTYEAAVAAVGTIAQQGDPGTIKGAINMVSAQRATLGALQNRLEHTINNIGVTTENVTAAESRIRDTDMAYEMMLYTKNSILVQAAQAMLAQANMVPQGVLQLLR